jgi:hypothetical protein
MTREEAVLETWSTDRAGLSDLGREKKKSAMRSQRTMLGDFKGEVEVNTLDRPHTQGDKHVS